MSKDIRVRRIIPDCFVIVAELVLSDGSSQIAGYCLWNHDGKSKTYGQLQDEGGKENPMQGRLAGGWARNRN